MVDLFELQSHTTKDPNVDFISRVLAQNNTTNVQSSSSSSSCEDAAANVSVKARA